MIIAHHPSDETLGAFAAGTLDEAQRLLVAVHVSRCAVCRDAVDAFVLVGGAVLETIEPVALAPDALAGTLSRLPPHEPRPAGPLPAPLSRVPRGAWIWIGPGVQYAPVERRTAGSARAFMLKAKPGTRLLDHTHTDTEWTCVLKGAFQHDHGYFGPGDFEEADATVLHRPRVTEDGECICLVALRGDLHYSGWVGRLIQPFARL